MSFGRYSIAYNLGPQGKAMRHWLVTWENLTEFLYVLSKCNGSNHTLCMPLFLMQQKCPSDCKISHVALHISKNWDWKDRTSTLTRLSHHYTCNAQIPDWPGKIVRNQRWQQSLWQVIRKRSIKYNWFSIISSCMTAKYDTVQEMQALSLFALSPKRSWRRKGPFPSQNVCIMYTEIMPIRQILPFKATVQIDTSVNTYCC